MNFTSPFNPQSNDLFVNGIWLASLMLMLITALISVLVQQWLQFYVSDVCGSPRTKARIRQFQFMGLSIWAVPFIIDILPALMNMSIFLFFHGLVFFLRGLSGTGGIMWVINWLTLI